MQVLFGDGAARWLSLAVIVSVLGSLAANIIPAPRIAWAAAQDGRLPAPFARLHPRFATPAFGLVFQAVFAAALTVSGKFDELVATVSFAATFFYALGGAALFVYRRRAADAPWKTPGYPWVPAFYVARRSSSPSRSPSTPRRTPLRGLLILAAGVAVYAWQGAARGAALARRLGETLRLARLLLVRAREAERRVELAARLSLAAHELLRRREPLGPDEAEEVLRIGAELRDGREERREARRARRASRATRGPRPSRGAAAPPRPRTPEIGAPNEPPGPVKTTHASGARTEEQEGISSKDERTRRRVNVSPSGRRRMLSVESRPEGSCEETKHESPAPAP